MNTKRIKTTIVLALAVGILAARPLPAAELLISIGIRETGGTGPAFANGGTTGGIEWVNRDGQSLVTDGTWQQFVFTPSTDALTAFAGTTANSILEGGMEWSVFEHVRILNVEGITAPVRLWIDDITNTTAEGAAIFGFEGAAAGAESVFQEPAFSGSTSANVLAGSSSLVSASDAFMGSQSNEINFQFVDDDPSRWIRLTTFGTPDTLNPLIRVREATGGATTVSFYAKAVVVPEPTTAVLAWTGGALLLLLTRTRRRS
jgi:hypothetical protein